jgi:hypothetical protein
METERDCVKKRHKNYFWYQKHYNKSVTLLGFSDGKAVGKMFRPHDKQKRVSTNLLLKYFTSFLCDVWLQSESFNYGMTLHIRIGLHRTLIF